MIPVEEDEEVEDIEETEKRDKPRWMKKNIERKETESEIGKEREYASKKLSQNFPALSSSNEWDIFIKIFGGLIELLVHETNQYARYEKNCHGFEVTKEEMMNFIGLLFLSGYNIRSSEKDYWSKAQDLECPIFPATMSRNRFQEIKKFLHCADNANLGNEKMAKVKPLYDLLNENMRQFGILHEILSIDESMTPYYGRHSCKQFIRQKPIRFGFKSWVMASSTGMPYFVMIYEGKSENQLSKEPLGSRVIRECIFSCSEPTKHRFYFDNFFTSYDIVLDLKEKEINATGTIRSNRTKHCPLPTAKDMKKKPRGSYDFRSEGNVEIVTWNDNAVVTLCSNCEGVNPIGMAKRWKKGIGRVSIEQPFIVKAYNKGMGGVDLFDRSLSDFRPAIRGKKWYFPLIIAALNTGMVFCWRLHEISAGSTIPNKEYRRSIVQILVKRTKPERMHSKALRPGPKGSKALPPREVRTDNTNHRTQSLITSRRCIVCKKNGKIQCAKCKVTLHLKSCWQIFHEN